MDVDAKLSWLGTRPVRRQKFSEGGSLDTAGGLGAAQDSQKPLGIWCKILQSSNFDPKVDLSDF